MLSNAEFQLVEGHGWWRGFANMLRKENRQWWSGYRWLVQSLVWLVILNGLVVMSLFIIPAILVAGNAPEADTYIPVAQAISIFFQLGTMALGAGAIILVQDGVVAEKQSGVAEWLLSKPLSRSAYFLAKMAASMLIVTIVLVGLQSAVAYIIISFVNGGLYPILPFMVGVGGIWLHTFYYLALTLMMGVFVNNRSAVLSVPFGVLFAGMILPNIIGLYPTLMTPWAFGSLLGPYVQGISLPVSLGLPFTACTIWILLFTGLSLWKINRLEF